MSDDVRVLVSDDDRRAEQLVRDRFGLSRAESKALFGRGGVRLEGAGRVAPGTRLNAGQVLLVSPAVEATWIVPAPHIPLSVLYQDEEVVVVDKRAGQHAHPLRRGELETLASVVAARFPETADASEDPREGGIAHRLDQYTSGVTVFCRSRASWLAVREAFSRGQVEKLYLALVSGRLDAPATVALALAHHATDPTKIVTVDHEGATYRGSPQPASTSFHPLIVGSEISLVAVRCRTGRRHQVRVHAASLGHPLLGDSLYDGPQVQEEGALLHAAALRLPQRPEVASSDLERLRLAFMARADASADWAPVERWLATAPFGGPPVTLGQETG